MTLWQIVKFTFAILSLSDILVYQKIAEPIRSYFGFAESRGIWQDTGSTWRNFFGDVLQCFRCTSVWAALILTILSRLPGYSSLEALLAASWLATYLNRRSFE